MPLIETYTSGNGKVELEQIKIPWVRLLHGNLPEGVHLQIELAVKDFVKTSHPSQGVDAEGFYQQTLEAIAQAVFWGNGEFWLATDENQVLGYLLARIVKDIDNKVCYWISQCWVHKSWRGTPWVKESWQKIRARAKDLFCAHMVLVSSRGSKAYKRFLGVHDYAFLLKEDL